MGNDGHQRRFDRLLEYAAPFFESVSTTGLSWRRVRGRGPVRTGFSYKTAMNVFGAIEAFHRIPDAIRSFNTRQSSVFVSAILLIRIFLNSTGFNESSYLR